jgi:hypothetical protein
MPVSMEFLWTFGWRPSCERGGARFGTGRQLPVVDRRRPRLLDICSLHEVRIVDYRLTECEADSPGYSRMRIPLNEA